MSLTHQKAVQDFFDKDLQSPTDSSEDSVEVKVSTISYRNKRKCSEPRKRHDIQNGPIKKRMRYNFENVQETPFRPWNASPTIKVLSPVSPVPVVEKNRCEVRVAPSPTCSVTESPSKSVIAANNVEGTQRKEHRNYKNMTRERRIEANARERTRVHTISAAFDTLRRSVPSYSHNQKLSKLSVLRIACSYIMTLTNIVTGDHNAFCDSMENVTKTIQREGKLRKKKEDGD